MYRRSLFIFRRDLRVDDNTALIAALEQSEEVIPTFIFDPRQVGKNEYKSKKCVQFMVESLEDLYDQVKKRGGRVYFFKGKAEDIVETLLDEEGIDAVFVNQDHTPFSKRRDAIIRKRCAKRKVAFHAFHDLLLIDNPQDIMTGSGTPYTVFTPFYKNASGNEVREPQQNRKKNYFTGMIDSAETKSILSKIVEKNSGIAVRGGRDEAKKILKDMASFLRYESEREVPAKDKTTHLSAHNKFGTVSIREVYDTIKDTLPPGHDLIRQLYWRDFYTYIAHHFPHVFEGAFRKKYNKVKWDDDKKRFAAWKEGRTGFPLVDAGMRQLNETGYMHNRVRMIVASFLVKDLHLNWQWGEKYFAQQLVDYDPAVNNGNWQWAASTGCDAQPYFRIFNPWSQQKKHDPACEYIKHWVPELEGLEPKEIHNLMEEHPDGLDYPEPMVDHTEEAKEAKARFKKVV